MVAQPLFLSAFDERRLTDGWTRVTELSDFKAFRSFDNFSGDASHKRFGSHVMNQVKGAFSA